MISGAGCVMMYSKQTIRKVHTPPDVGPSIYICTHNSNSPIGSTEVEPNVLPLAMAITCSPCPADHVYRATVQIDIEVERDECPTYLPD